MATSLSFVPARKKGHFNPVLNGYRFCKDRKVDDKTYWKCVHHKAGCNARINTVDGQLTSPIPIHLFHDVQHAETAIHTAKVNLKRRAESSDLPTKFLAAEATAGMSFETAAKLNCQTSSLSRMARRARQATSQHPGNPTNLQSLILPPDYVKSHSGDALLMWDSGWDIQTRRSLIFATPGNIDAMTDAEHLIIDGTFKSAPKHFTQLFTLHGLFPDGWHLPLYYSLLPGKTTTLYRNVLEQIDLTGPYQPQSVLMDYELAIHNAVSSVWPSSTRRGCFFHFKKALFRNLVQSNLGEEYSVPDSDIRKSFALMGALAFVPENDVLTCWRHLEPLLPPDMADFTSYFQRTWIGSSSTDPMFDTAMWNQHDASLMLLPRSSNIAEGWHHGFNSMLSCSNPTIWKFLDCLKSEQSLNDVRLTKRLMREAPEPRAPKWIRYDNHLQTIVDAYDEYTNKMDYLKAIGVLTMM